MENKNDERNEETSQMDRLSVHYYQRKEEGGSEAQKTQTRAERSAISAEMVLK